jgi:hypothetical protein
MNEPISCNVRSDDSCKLQRIICTVWHQCIFYFSDHTYEAAPSDPRTGFATNSSTLAKASNDDWVLLGPFDEDMV